MNPALVEVIRSGVRECVHRGSVVILRPDGSPDLALGEVTQPIFPRSLNKPLQTLALLRNGFEPVDDAELAIVTASHYGESQHLALVRRLLARFALNEDDLRCPATEQGRRIAMNCSGKHAAMLATCLINDWPTDSYLSAEHPLARIVTASIREVTGEPPTTLAVDGCGLPITPVSLTRLATAYAAFVTAPEGSDRRRIADAVRAHPHLVSGTAAPDLRLMTSVPGLLCKIGADGLQAGALADGSAFAYKIDDGHDRARVPLATAILTRLDAPGIPKLADAMSTPVYGGDMPVGVVRAVQGVF